jgi:amino acid permease
MSGEFLTTTIWLAWIGISLFNVMLIGHEYASQARPDGGETFFKCLVGVIAAPFFLMFSIGYKIKRFPKIKVTFNKDGQ